MPSAEYVQRYYRMRKAHQAYLQFKGDSKDPAFRALGDRYYDALRYVIEHSDSGITMPAWLS